MTHRHNEETPPAIKAGGAENIFHHDFAEGTSRNEQCSPLPV